MPRDLAAQCPQSASLLARAAGSRTKAGWWEMFLPILLELFQELLENCFEDQAEFVETVGSLNSRNVDRLERVNRRALRQAKVGAPRLRRGKAQLLADDIATECDTASEDELGECYDELMG